MKEVDNINSQNGSEIENYENEIKTNDQNDANNNIEVPKAAEPDNINDNKKNVEIYDLTDDDIDNSDYVEKVKNSAPVVKKAYKVQTTKEDKILFGVLNSVINDVNQTTILPENDMKIEFLEGITEEEKQSAIDEAKNVGEYSIIKAGSTINNKTINYDYYSTRSPFAITSKLKDNNLNINLII